MADAKVSIDGAPVPQFMYGTAWKEDSTQQLTELAIRQGFRAIDTANQRRHYYEAAVGRGVAAAIEQGIVSRDDLFLQTKFTFRPAQDHRLPYDPSAPIAEQVAQSFESSLTHFQTDKLDSLVLHGPMYQTGLTDADWEAWRAMEALHERGLVRFLGVSNVSEAQLEEFVHGARIRPRFVQNRCFAIHGWDQAIRHFCKSAGIVYQGFSLLTANREAFMHPGVSRIATGHERTIAQIIFRFAIEVGMIPLTGTTSADHMQADLAVFDFRLTPQEVAEIEEVAR